MWHNLLGLIRVYGNGLFLNEKVAQNITNKKVSVVFKKQTKVVILYI